MIRKIRSVFNSEPNQENTRATAIRSGKYFKRCILHIGTEKTGTSSIQSFLCNNRASLSSKGALYSAVSGERGGSQWGFVAAANPNSWKTDVGRELGICSEIDQARFKDEFRTRLVAEFDSIDETEDLIISSEHLHSRLINTNMIRDLRKFLEQWVESFEVVLYLRRQDKVAVSLYSTKIKSGNPTPILFPGSPEEGLNYYFDYEQIYSNWCEVFGQDNVHARLFSSREWEANNLLVDFCSICGIDPTGKQMPVIENESLDRKGSQFLIEVNRQLPNLVDGQKNRERESFMHLVYQLSKGKSHPASRQEAMKFYQQFIEGNERLRQKAFPDRLDPLFDEDFSAYPESIEAMEPNYAEAVEIAIRIWRSCANK